jgi:exodeoxyribonuclease V gamma subunit
MFRLHTSNDAAKLADALGEQLCAARDNPLVPARVLVPQAGLKRWLQVHLAEHKGVIANVEFTAPAQFAWELLRAARPELPERSPFDVEVLRWHLYVLLGERLDGAALAPLREYLSSVTDPLRRFALSLELARVYERMQGYRREKLLAWERGADPGHWQAELWRRVLPRVGGMSRAARVDDWLRRFDPEYPPGGFEEKPAPPGLPGSFACFACSNVSPDVLRMLAVAGLHCSVDFHLPLPSRGYLGDTPTGRREVWQWLRDKQGGNPLITSQGGALAGFIELLYGYRHVQPDDEVDLFDDGIDRTTLLGRVRDDILDHAAPGDDRSTALPDDSIQFHACHTPLREVQTLHDALLAMFEKDSTLQPRDVAVMAPDIALYAPAIEAVFGGIERGDPHWLPFNLGDAGAAALHPVAQLFLDLLDAPGSRWEANALLDVLAVPGVMRRFDLDSDAVTRLSRRLRDAGVRWGEDERARAGCGDYREFSWAFGIERVLAGFAVGDAAATELVGDTAPVQGVEGSAVADLDAVLAILETWRKLRDESPHPRTAAVWQAFLNATLDGLYQPDRRDTAELRALERIRGALATLARDCGAADADLVLPWADVRAFLRDALGAADPRQYLFTGGITFCGMVPLRVVPFRVICLLGMDEAAFPRHEANGLDPLLADRRAGHAGRGDRDVRADDRLLFLQLLAAARDTFYVSWVGRDAHTNEARPPSVVVSELLDMLKQGYLLRAADEAARKAQSASLPRVAPLHPFDAALFGANGEPPRSFQVPWRPAAAARRRSVDALPPFASCALPPPATPDNEIRLDELKRFFDDPARGFLEGTLQLRLPRDADEDADLEPLQPDHPLLRYDLASALLEHGDADAARARKLLRAQGRLPPGGLADAALDIARERADRLRAAIDAFTRGEPRLDDITARVQLDPGTWLSGTVTGMHPAGLVRYSPGGLSGKRVLRAWLDTLFVALVRDAGTLCRFLWVDGGDVEERDLKVAGAAEAHAQWSRLVAAWRDGLRQPLPLFPEASLAAFRPERKKPSSLDEDEARADFIDALAKIAANADDDGPYAHGRDFDKPSVRLAWRGIAITREDTALAARLYDTACALFPRLHVPLSEARS